MPYLRRLRVVQTPWFGVLALPDPVPRRPRRTRLANGPAGRPGEYRTRIHRCGSLHLMGTGSAHRIVEAAPGLKTLILTGPRRGGWGFYREGRFIPWQEYVHSYERGGVGVA